MPLTDRSQARESGFAQVREALQKFEGTVVNAEFDQWGGQLFDDGKPIAPKEFLEISNIDVKVLEVTEDLAMDIDEWNFRVNCSDYKGSFWIEKFLERADRLKVLIPDDLKGKRCVWVKDSMTFNIKGREVTQTNFVLESIKPVTAKAASAKAVEDEEVTMAEESDSMGLALELALKKTEQQFRTAISLDPRFSGSPLLPMAKAGVITQSLVNDGKLVVVDGKYQRPDVIT